MRKSDEPLQPAGRSKVPPAGLCAGLSKFDPVEFGGDGGSETFKAEQFILQGSASPDRENRDQRTAKDFASLLDCTEKLATEQER